MTLQSLIDKQDNFEIVRDQIAAILTTEVSNQMTLAAAALKDPTLWKLRVYTERFNAWSQFQATDVDDTSPIVNVWYDSSAFPTGRGSTVERQQAQGRFNIDIFGYGESHADGAGGHKAGDKESSLEMARALRLVRNVLMAGENTYLQLRGLVGFRWPDSITAYQPEGANATKITAARFILRVDFNEFSPQYEGETLETITADVHRTEDGQIVIEAEYDYTAP